MGEIKKLPALNFNEALQAGLENMKDFDGRARRSEFWWFMLGGVIVITVEMVLMDVVLGMATLGCIVAELVMLGCLSVTVRRLHDAGRNGMWAFSSFSLQVVNLLILLFVTDGGSVSDTEAMQNIMGNTFFLGVSALDAIINVIIIIFCLCDSVRGENDYGESTKYKEDA